MIAKPCNFAARHRAFGRWVRMTRESRGMKQKILAGLADIDVSVLCKIEKGEVRATLSNYWALLDILQPSCLVRDASPMPSVPRRQLYAFQSPQLSPRQPLQRV